MPELPEVETVRVALERSVKGKKIKKVMLAREGLRTPFPPNLAKALEEAVIKSISRRAKYLLLSLSNGKTLIVHLGMTGRFSAYEKALPDPVKHDHVLFSFTDGSSLVFNDARRFGLMALTDSEEIAAHTLLAGLGPEPLDRAFSASYLQVQLSRRKAPVKVALMDQTLVVGVGNIYASEALFLAKIHPAHTGADVADKSQKIVTAIREVLRAAIKSGGSSLRDFASVNGESGYFQHEFKVYGRKGKPCLSCKKGIIMQIRQAGRSTFFCPNCQK